MAEYNVPQWKGGPDLDNEITQQTEAQQEIGSISSLAPVSASELDPECDVVLKTSLDNPLMKILGRDEPKLSGYEPPEPSLDPEPFLKPYGYEPSEPSLGMEPDGPPSGMVRNPEFDQYMNGTGYFPDGPPDQFIRAPEPEPTRNTLEVKPKLDLEKLAKDIDKCLGEWYQDTDEEGLYKIASQLSIEELKQVAEIYKRNTGRDMIDDLRGDLSADELETFTTCLQGVDPSVAAAAQMLSITPGLVLGSFIGYLESQGVFEQARELYNLMYTSAEKKEAVKS